MIIKLDPENELFRKVGRLCNSIFGIEGCVEWFYSYGGEYSSNIIVDINEQNGEIMGLCVWAPDDSKKVNITHIATVEKYRRRGIGTGLLQWM